MKSKKELQKAFTKIHDRYKNQQAKVGFQSDAELEAYRLYRMPATQAVLWKVFSFFESGTLETALELGCGPGSSYPVLRDLLIKKIVYIEKEAGFHQNLEGVEWITRNFLENFSYPSTDLTLFSYALGELSLEEQRLALKKATAATRNFVVVVEPGTPNGFETVLQARDFLIENGYHIHAPCWHDALCPRGAKKPWCHFSVRLERSRMHREIKGGTLGYEDEKYSYIIASKQPVLQKKFTLLDRPKIEKHRVQMNLCSRDGEFVFECKSNRPTLFKLLKKKGWGENLDSAIILPDHR